MTTARRATNAIFLVCGTATSAWAPMVPFAKTGLGLSDAALGVILLALGGGSMMAMPLAGLTIHYWGCRPVIVTATVIACVALPFLAVPMTPWLLASTLLAFGVGLGALDVAMNAQAIAVQQAAGRPIMSGFHAHFSVGGLVGAALIALLLWTGLPLPIAALTMAILLLAIGLTQQHHFLRDGGNAGTRTLTIVPKPRVVLLGALCFISFLAEGAVLDWSAVFLRDVHHIDISIAGVGYVVFSIAMVVGRLTGDALTHRFGAAPMLRAGGALAGAGFLIAAIVPSAVGASAGFLIFGAGVANVVPVLFSTAGRVPGVPPGVALATVTTIAYAGLLAGPPLIGLVANATSLAVAFVAVAGMLATIAAASPLVRSAT